MVHVVRKQGCQRLRQSQSAGKVECPREHRQDWAQAGAAGGSQGVEI